MADGDGAQFFCRIFLFAQSFFILIWFNIMLETVPSSPYLAGSSFWSGILLIESFFILQFIPHGE
jgi:hypothetical protein